MTTGFSNEAPSVDLFLTVTVYLRRPFVEAMPLTALSSFSISRIGSTTGLTWTVALSLPSFGTSVQSVPVSFHFG